MGGPQRVRRSCSCDRCRPARSLAGNARTTRRGRGLGRPARTPVAQRYLTALADANAQVRINALRALATYREEPLVSRIAALLLDPDGNVAITAAQVLADLKFPSSAAALSGVASDPTVPLALRGAALASLTRRPLRRQRLQSNVRAHDAGNWLARYYAAQALGALPLPAAEPIARPLMDDADARVATAALESIVAIDTDSLAPLPRVYIQRLGVSDAMVRAAALRGLEKHASADLLPIALDAYDRATKDKDNDAALAAIDLLGANPEARRSPLHGLLRAVSALA